MTEHTLQQSCIAIFRNKIERYGKGAIIPIPNELAAKRRDIEIHLGASDLILVVPNCVLFCELKTATGVQSLVQKRFQNLVESLGFQYHLVRSIDQFKTLIEQWQN